MKKYIGIFLLCIPCMLWSKNYDNKHFRFRIDIPDTCMVEIDNTKDICMKVTTPNHSHTFYVVALKANEEAVWKDNFAEIADTVYFKLGHLKEERKNFYVHEIDRCYQSDDGKMAWSKCYNGGQFMYVLCGFSYENESKLIKTCMESFSPSHQKSKWLFNLIIIALLLVIGFSLGHFFKSSWIAWVLLIGWSFYLIFHDCLVDFHRDYIGFWQVFWEVLEVFS
ncbi:hypothetical protein [Bacteroides cellulosilyticus]|jgi:hypothetical protein|uniref:hypothetical protein n=1 Tax=Bacteroides cellulosilyticus TaxID=246787 RepID=UPI0032C1B0A3